MAFEAPRAPFPPSRAGGTPMALSQPHKRPAPWPVFLADPHTAKPARPCFSLQLLVSTVEESATSPGSQNFPRTATDTGESLVSVLPTLRVSNCRNPRRLLRPVWPFFRCGFRQVSRAFFFVCWLHERFSFGSKARRRCRRPILHKSMALHANRYERLAGLISPLLFPIRP